MMFIRVTGSCASGHETFGELGEAHPQKDKDSPHWSFEKRMLQVQNGDFKFDTLTCSKLMRLGVRFFVTTSPEEYMERILECEKLFLFQRKLLFTAMYFN
jgi:hypothetical protein